MKALAVIVAILIVIAGIAISWITGDNGVVTKAAKVEEEYSKTEVSEALAKYLHDKLLDASNQIKGTTNDISTIYNENNLIPFLENSNESEVPGIDCIDAYENAEKVQNASGDGEVYTIYIIKPKTLSSEVDSHGNGNMDTGDVFTLEPIIQEVEGVKKSTGKYEVKYYNSNKEVSVIDTVDLYLNNQS